MTKSSAAIVLASIICLSGAAQSVRPEQPQTLDLTKVLGSERLCAVGNGSVQFVNEDTLVLLAGSETNCYRAVQALELVTLKTDGRIVARKPWPSTFPFVAMDSRVVVGGVGNFFVLNDTLQTIQTLSLPTGERSSVFLQKEGTSTLLARLPRGETFAYSGVPLAEEKYQKTTSGDGTVLHRKSGEIVALRKKELLTVEPGGETRHLADLSWLQDCNSLCQAWVSGIRLAVSANGERAAFVSGGTRFPITDDSGMFPFWRVLVVDLSNGKEVFRKEFATNIDRRCAQLSPAGDLLLLSDGDKLQFKSLP